MFKCLNCGKEFIPSKNDKRIKFCSVSCYSEYRIKNGYLKEYYQKNKHRWQELQGTQEFKDKKNELRRKKYAEDEEYREKCKEKARYYGKKYPKKKKLQRALANYGVTEEKYNEMLEQQNYKCAICGYSDMSSVNFFPVIDHNHTTNKVRGLLCMNCNMGLGKFKDNINFLQNAIKYLEKNNG